MADVAAAVAITTIVIALLLVLAYRIGRSVTDRECEQLRISFAEAMSKLTGARKQLLAVREAVSDLRHSHQTAPHTQLALERILEGPLCDRQATGRIDRIERPLLE